MPGYKKAKPNEWLLLIKDGRLAKCGVGIRVWKRMSSTVVKFPATMQETSFEASQTTKQRAGVTVKGKAYWSIYRPVEGDPNGPFRAYQTLDGLDKGDFSAASEKVRTLAISTTRAAVANMTIDEVMVNRQQLKDSVKKTIVDTFRGWGVWLETLEILDVRVDSRQLFDDMQYLKGSDLHFETKAEASLVAERLRIQTQTELVRLKTAAALDQAKEKAEALAKQKIFEAQQQLKHAQEEAQLAEARQAIKLEHMKHEHAVQMKAATDASAVSDAKLVHKLQQERKEADQKIELIQRERDVEKTYEPVHLQLAALKAATEIYKGLPLKEVKLVSMGGAGAASLESLITPAMEILNLHKDVGRSTVPS